jgi:hypothetical protein
MNRYRTFLTLCLTVMLFIPATVKVSLAVEDSVVIGRLLGTIQPLPLNFSRSDRLIANNYHPEFLGFRLFNSQSGKKVKVHPDGSGYFSKSLAPGTWVLERYRKDRTSGDVPKEFKIMTFDVPEESLVNLGTIRVVVEGEPEERLQGSGGQSKGIYTYTYHYERAGEADGFSWPVDKFKKKKSDAFEKYQGSIVQIKEPVTAEKDGSKIRITENSS